MAIIKELSNIGFDLETLCKVASYGIKVSYVDHKVYFDYIDKLGDVKDITPLEIIDQSMFTGAEALVMLHKIFAKGLWQGRIVGEDGSPEDFYIDILDIPLCFFERDSDSFGATFSALGNINRPFKHYGMTMDPDKSRGFIIHLFLRTEIDSNGKIIKFPSRSTGVTIKSGKIVNQTTIDGDLPKPEISSINKLALSLVPIGIKTELVQSQQMPIDLSMLDQYNHISVKDFNPYADKLGENPDLAYKTSKGNRSALTQSQLVSGNYYTGHKVRPKQKYQSRDTTKGEKYLTRKHTFLKPFPGLKDDTKIKYVFSVSGHTVWVDILELNGQILDFSIPLFKTHISIEPGFTQPKINLVTISFTIPKILGGKIDYPVMEAIVYKLLQTRYTELNETGTYTKGERWKQTPFTIKAYQDLGFRLDPNGVWIDWYNNRDTQLLSQFQDDKVYLDDGKYYEGVSVFVNPVGYESVESLWDAVIKGENNLEKIQQNQNTVLQKLQTSQRLMVNGGEDTSNRAKLISLGYNLSGMNSKQVKSLYSKLKRKGKI